MNPYSHHAYLAYQTQNHYDNHQQQQQTQQPPSSVQYNNFNQQQSNNYPLTNNNYQQQAPQQQQSTIQSNQQLNNQYQQQNNYVNNNQQQQYYQQQTNDLANNFSGMTINRGFNQGMNVEGFNLLSDRNVKLKAKLLYENNGSDVIRCTLNKIPESSSILQKSRLPLGLLLHPFKDKETPVIQNRTIVRCRACRTYINPYVRVLDQRRWQCNLCLRLNDLPDDFLIDSNTGHYLDYPMNQPELTHTSIEYVASVEYMVRPPQSAAYLFVFDCSVYAHALGYLPIMARTILESIDSIPGDSRTLIGFIGFDSNINLFHLGGDKPYHMVMPDIQDPFVPSMNDILVNLQEKKDLIEQFLADIVPNLKNDNSDTGSALGPALTLAQKILASNGGRITVFQATLPNAGSPKDGSILKNREDPNNRTVNTSSANSLTPLLNPANDYFKKLALECSEAQIAVDLFVLCPNYADIATISPISKVTGGSVFYYPASTKPGRLLARFECDFEYYLSRSIGFEAVLRIRTTKGFSIQSFFGNFFVRSPDLLALPNCNPDSGYGIQLSIDEELKDFSYACFQAAILYTNTAGERRIKVHTIGFPVVGTIHEVINNADQEAVIGLLVKMAAERSIQGNLADAREALINCAIDLLQTYKNLNPIECVKGLVTSKSTVLIPLFISALLKHIAFRLNISTKVDERVYALEQMKSLPLPYLLTYCYPDLYPVHYEINWETGEWPASMQLSYANIQSDGAYILDAHDVMILYICKNINLKWISDVFGVSTFNQIPDDGESDQVNLSHHTNHHLNQSTNSPVADQKPTLVVPIVQYDNAASIGLVQFINALIETRPFKPNFYIIRDDSRIRHVFLQYMFDDRSESSFSYYEFLQHLQTQAKT